MTKSPQLYFNSWDDFSFIKEAFNFIIKSKNVNI